MSKSALSFKTKTKVASAGNRTRAARVAGEHSTTEPLMLLFMWLTYTDDKKFNDTLLQLTMTEVQFECFM